MPKRTRHLVAFEGLELRFYWADTLQELTDWERRLLPGEFVQVLAYPDDTLVRILTPDGEHNGRLVLVRPAPTRQ